MRNRRVLIVVIVILAIIALALLAVFNKNNLPGPLGKKNNPTVNINPNPLPGEIATSGWTVCLQPTTGPGCVMGLAGDDGKTYALNLIAGQVKDEGLHVRVVGTYTPKAGADSALESGALVYNGVLDVRVIQKTD